jgi:hypothetical protein
LVVTDCGGHLVLFTGVAPAEAGRPRLNEPALLGRGQKAEIQRGKTIAEEWLFWFIRFIHTWW